jgi:ferric-dicitrate binding protein FerR (iron transport regulator)
MDWCKLSEENKTEFISLRKAWAISENIDKKIAEAKPSIWNNIINNISAHTPKIYTKRNLFYYSSISAAVALFLMFGVNLYINKSLLNNTVASTNMYIPKGEKGQLYLPDGTKVWLNSDSKLTFSSDFNTKNRVVILEGEAYFDVTKNEKHKFTVKTAQLDVVVHGTAFNVSAYTQSPNINISLQRGAISVLKSTSSELLASLLPNQSISIDKQLYTTRVNTFEADSDIAWTFEELIFEHASIDEVFSKMENWYGVNITLTSSKPDLKYRFKVKSESLTEILQLINKITPIEYQVDGKEVIVNYK